MGTNIALRCLFLIEKYEKFKIVTFCMGLGQNTLNQRINVGGQIHGAVK